MKELQVFSNESFGDVRVIMIDGEPWFVAVDVCKALDIENTSQAIAKLDSDERSMFNIGRQGNTNVLNEYGLYNLILTSRKPEAKEFKRWVTHDVLPSIRKTGAYSLVQDKNVELKRQDLDIRLRDVKVREAEVLLKIAEKINVPEYKYILQSKAAENITGEPILPLQAVERKTYSATEIGKMYGVSANKIGKIANAHGLKTAEYGNLFYDKARYSSKQVETWRYYDSAIPVFREILKGGASEDI